MSREKRRLHGLILAGALLAGVSGTVAPHAGAVSPGSTEVISVGAEGNDTVGAASSPTISANGLQVAFESRVALDPVVRPSENPRSDIYVRDRRAPGRTVLISRGLPQSSLSASRGYSAPQRAAAPLEEGGNGDSLRPTISADGRYVAFQSQATNLQDGYFDFGHRIVLCDRDPDGDAIFDEQRSNGTMDYLYLYVGPSRNPVGATIGTAPSLSENAGVIAWLEQPPGTSQPRTVVAQLIRDAAGRLSTPPAASFLRPARTGVAHASPQVSANGQQVVFATGDCSVSCLPGTATVEVFELSSRRTYRIDVIPGGGYSGAAAQPSISGSGKLIAYEHRPGPAGPVLTVVVNRDPAGTGRLGPADGVLVTASIASRDVDGQAREGRSPALSADGRYLAFQSVADKLHGDVQGTGRQAIVLRDLTLDATRERSGLPRLPGELASPAAAANCDGEPGAVCPASGPSGSPRLAANGSVVVFASVGDDLLPEPCCEGAVFARVLKPRISTVATDLGPVELGKVLSRTVVVRHTGFGPLTVSGLVLSGPGTSGFTLTGAENCTGATLNPTETCSVGIVFAPTAVGQHQVALRVSQPDSTTDEIVLIAQGTKSPGEESPGPAPTGQLEITPDPLDFGGSLPALVMLGPRIVQVRNTTAVPIRIIKVGVLIGPRFTVGDFAVAKSSCAGITLAAGSSCSIDLVSTPQNSGPRNGVLAVTTADPAYSRLIALRSQAVQPVLQVNPGVVRMNRVAAVTGQGFPPSRPVTLTLRTPGNKLQLGAVTKLDGTVSAALLVFPQTSAGTWPVVASVDGTPVRAQAPILLVPGSYQPPGFTSRR
ncbi:choice-of-anchor D domain-containing protein [Kribbella sp. NBC_01505]|uniref:choice-of-anchor D domain-containing protein n=1 Tax=Kribbella sp. NBC_01505 TaxID=2903580 RepID=UPI003868DA18